MKKKKKRKKKKKKEKKFARPDRIRKLLMFAPIGSSAGRPRLLLTLLFVCRSFSDHSKSAESKQTNSNKLLFVCVCVCLCEKATARPIGTS